MVVLDTLTVLFWSQNRSLLSEPALNAINEADSIGIPVISLWEIGWKLKMGRLRLPVTAEELRERLHRVDRVTFLATTADIWLATVNLDWGHRDSADRVIVATAMLNRCPLVTSDKLVRQYYDRAVW